ncbi:uncharacterized protein V1513DRAFT_415702 [Lipomyces chichibuensis]|uniref:uncharacterized protein n=1 Tax=Lipomyces chichibuensis TaxID=1546026 RepID=UPI0033436472
MAFDHVKEQNIGFEEPVRIRHTDEEAGDNSQRWKPRDSIFSSGGHSRRNSIDPAAALPITYRTMSMDIDETQDQKKREDLKLASARAAKDLSELDWHIVSHSELYIRLSTSSVEGLSAEQVKRRLAEYGKNTPSSPPSHLFQDWFGYLLGGFGSILLVSSILVFVAWKPLGQPPAVANLALAIVLLAVFFLQAAFNAWQDFSSSRVMASITGMLPDECQILRDGIRTSTAAAEIVPGDVIFFRAGSKLPADIRFIEISSDTKFDRSILTGESIPWPATVDSTNNNYLETRCIGLQGTFCSSGSGVGVVVATGDRTVFGRIAKLASQPTTGMTTLQKEVYLFCIVICTLMLIMIVVVLIVWGSWLRKDHPSWINVPTLIVSCVSVAVAFIPEGLPIAVTASLTITANLMRKNKILCKSLKTVETLGSVSVICTDKTGTLTKNNMWVTDCAIGSLTMPLQLATDRHFAEKQQSSNTALNQLRSIASLCNAGQFDITTSGLPLANRKINGDATDQAVLRFAETLGPVAEVRAVWDRQFELPFNSKNKFMISVFSLAKDIGRDITLSAVESEAFSEEELLLTIKGAPDIIISRCNRYINDDGVSCPLDSNTRETIENIKNKWSREGKRVILLARKILPWATVEASQLAVEFGKEALEHARSGLTLVGMVGIMDPPREEIPGVISTLRRAGIRIFMVTGDFVLTAEAIARECRIISNPPERVHDVSALRDDASAASSGDQVSSIVISGSELTMLNGSQWKQLCQYDEIVFARTTPEQKLRIVKEFQSRHEIVGMTGDGVNDAPSLKAADIGIALGSGSDIAIEASDMVLLDKFDAIVEAVEYGRVVFDNLKKTVAYLLPAGSYAEFWPVITNVVLGLPQVLSSFLMIIICCFTDCAAATMLAFEKAESDVLLRPPRRPKKDRLVSWRLILQAYGFVGTLETVCSFAMSYWYLQRHGVPFSALWLGFGAIPDGMSSDVYTQRLNEASSIYFVNLVVMQWFNLMAVRTRRQSIFQMPPLFNKETQNLYLFPAILFALLMTFFWLYIPKFQTTLGTTSVPAIHFFLPMCFGFSILVLEEGRKYLVRKYPKGLLAKCAW